MMSSYLSWGHVDRKGERGGEGEWRESDMEDQACMQMVFLRIIVSKSDYQKGGGEIGEVGIKSRLHVMGIDRPQCT